MGFKFFTFNTGGRRSGVQESRLFISSKHPPEIFSKVNFPQSKIMSKRKQVKNACGIICRFIVYFVELICSELPKGLQKM
jgi:hypothetical protein